MQGRQAKLKNRHTSNKREIGTDEFPVFFFYADILATIMVMWAGDFSASVLMQLPHTEKGLYLEVIK